MLDKLKACPYASCLWDCATAVLQSADLPECEQKTEFVMTMAEVGIRKYTFQDAVSSQSYTFRHSPPEKQEPHQCIQKCIELRCENLIPTVIDMLARCPAELSASDTQACAEKLMAPLLQLWTKDATITQHAAQSLDNLRMVTLRLLVESIATNPAENLDEARLERVLQTAIVDGRMDLLFSMYVLVLSHPPLTRSFVLISLAKGRATSSSRSRHRNSPSSCARQAQADRIWC